MVRTAVDGLFVPKTFRSSYAVDVSFLGRFVPWTFRFLDDSFPGRFVPWTFRSAGRRLRRDGSICNSRPRVIVIGGAAG